MKPTANAIAISSGRKLDLVSAASEEDEDELEGEEPVLPAWLKGSLSPAPVEDEVAVLVELELLVLLVEVASVVAGPMPLLAALVVDEDLLVPEELGPEEDGALVPVEDADEEIAVPPLSGDVPDFVPKPILALSKSRTVYTFFKNTSPRIQSLGPNAWCPMMLLWQPLPLCLPT